LVDRSHRPFRGEAHKVVFDFGVALASITIIPACFRFEAVESDDCAGEAAVARLMVESENGEWKGVEPKLNVLSTLLILLKKD
ncbi:MAG: hypothetical protein AAF357_16575, partial [Verrucomicrobiota bacterium]